MPSEVWSLIVENTDVRDWFAEYLDAFVACCRGDLETPSLLAYYGVPLLLTTDGGFYALASDDQVVAGVGQQVNEMRAAGFDHTEVFGSDVTVINKTSAFYHSTFSRQRSDGSEINRVTGTYLVTDGPAGRRISVLAVHSTV